MYKQTILIIQILICGVSCNPANNTLPEEGDSFIPQFKELMLLFAVLLFTYGVQSVLSRFDIPTPYGAFIIIAGVLWGTLAKHNSAVLEFSNVIYISAIDILSVYTPVVVFHISFCMDAQILLKTLPQVLIIGVVVSITTGIFFGLIIKLVIDSSWSLKMGLFFGIFCIPIYPMSIVHLLKQQSSRTRQISVLLEGEAIISYVVTTIVYSLLLNKVRGFVLHWYQFTLLLVRFIFLGIIAGYIIGLFSQYLTRKVYSDRLSVIVVIFTIPFFAYHLSEVYISGCGAASIIVVGAMMGMERTALSKETEKFLTDVWEVTGFALESFMCFTTAVYAAVLIMPFMEWTDYIMVMVIYFMYYITRFNCFLLFSPIISRLGYGMNLKNMIVCVWGGLKSPFSLAVMELLLAEDFYEDASKKAYFHIIGIYFLSLLINGSFTRLMLDFMGLRQISMARQVNMNNCMKHIFQARERTIAILKMDRFLCDTNWPIVIEATNMKHPYQIGLRPEDEDDFFLGYRFSNCPDCLKELVQEPTHKELKEMKREAKMRVLKAKKMSYSRQYENGMMSKEGIRILSQAVELAMDTEEAVIELDGLQKRFTEGNWINRFVKRRFENLKKSKKNAIKPPRKYWRKVCYNIALEGTFDKFVVAVIVVDIVMMLTELYLRHSIHLSGPSQNLTLSYVATGIGAVAFVVYSVEFVIKIMAYSWIYICAHGFRRYFRSFWNVIDFGVLLITALNLVDNIRILTTHKAEYDTTSLIIDYLRLTRMLRFARVIEKLYPTIIRHLDANVDTKMAFTYELGKCYATGEAEILDMLPYMIDNKEIKHEVKQKIEGDRVIITKLLGLVQKESPWIAITVKTKQAIRTILNSMQEALNQLKASGWVDEYELDKLVGSMTELHRKVNSIKKVQPSAPKVIFKEVAWMAGDQAVIDFLFENVTVKKFEPGDVVFGEGDVAGGIYIVVTGLFMIKYIPNKNILNSLQEFGQLPIGDYLSSTQYDEEFVDYIVSGNCIGELSTLTQRPYNCTITADSHSQVYVLSRGIITRAMELSPDPVMGLECRLWKEVSVRIAVPLLLTIPTYQTFSQDQIKYALERAFVPNLSNYKIFVITDMIQDVIIIEGIAADFNTREVFVAPCCIPRTVQKLILPTSSLMNIPINIETRLMIIPEKDIDEYDVMILAEETCEMVARRSSSKCLQHTVRQRSQKRRRVKMRGLTSSSRGTKHAAEGASKESGMKQASKVSAAASGGALFFQSSVTTSINMGEEVENRALDYQELTTEEPRPSPRRRATLYFD